MMEETFMNAVAEKLELMEKKLNSPTIEKSQIDAIQGNQGDMVTEINSLKPPLISLVKEIKHLSGELKQRLETLSVENKQQLALLKEPPKPENPLKRPFSYLLGGCILLTLFLALAFSLLILNHQKLDKYVANDTKYRSLELITDDRLQQFLYIADSIYRENPKMRKTVQKLEEKRKQKLELLQEAKKKQQEAKALKEKAGKIDGGS